jgi:hypothetical protein
MSKLTDRIVQDLMDGKDVDVEETIIDLMGEQIDSMGDDDDIEDIKLTADDKKWLFAKARDFKAEAEYFETIEPNEAKANRLYDIADKLWDIGKE